MAPIPIVETTMQPPWLTLRMFLWIGRPFATIAITTPIPMLVRLRIGRTPLSTNNANIAVGTVA